MGPISKKAVPKRGRKRAASKKKSSKRLKVSVPRPTRVLTVVRKFQDSISTIASVQNITAPGGYYASHGQTFTLNTLQDVSLFYQLYDQYRINAITVTFEPLITEAYDDLSTGVPIRKYPPILITLLDPDDSSVAGSDYAVWMENPRSRKRILNRVHSFTFKPKLLMPAYNTGITNGYVPTKTRFISIADDNVPHYALKWFLYDQYASSVGSSPLARITYKYNVSFRVAV